MKIYFLCALFFMILILAGSKPGLAGFLVFIASIIYLYNLTKKEEREKEEKERKEEEEKERRAQEKLTQLKILRDAHSQDKPYYYEIGRHANETLALRYGIANLFIASSEDEFFAQRLEMGANSIERESKTKARNKERKFIKIRKIRPAGMVSKHNGKEDIKPAVFLVELPEFRNRQALAVIEPGTEYVKTFLPMKESWFDDNKALEEVVKGNITLSLRDIVIFHVEKTIN